MRRMLLLFTVAAMMAAMMAVAGAASATVHSLANSECANASASDVATLQDPPGLTPAQFVPGGSETVKGSPPNNPTGTTLAQPIFAVEAAQGSDAKAFKTPPGPGTATYCPANK